MAALLPSFCPDYKNLDLGRQFILLSTYFGLDSHESKRATRQRQSDLLKVKHYRLLMCTGYMRPKFGNRIMMQTEPEN